MLRAPARTGRYACCINVGDEFEIRRVKTRRGGEACVQAPFAPARRLKMRGDCFCFGGKKFFFESPCRKELARQPVMAWPQPIAALTLLAAKCLDGPVTLKSTVTPPSVQEYLFGNDWKSRPGKVEECRAMYQFARRDKIPGCRKLVFDFANARTTLQLTEGARELWRLAKAGNVMNWVVRCSTGQVHLWPQPARRRFASQRDWFQADHIAASLNTKIVPPSMKTRFSSCYGAANCNHANVLEAFILTYGTEREKSAASPGLQLQDFANFQSLMGDFLGELYRGETF